MESLILEKTNSTPALILSKAGNTFKICGKSLPEDALGFYQPIINWFYLYLKNPNASTTVVFELEYFNSASSRAFIVMLRMLEGLLNKGLDVKIDWRYATEDTDTLEAGSDFASLVRVPFVFNELSTVCV